MKELSIIPQPVSIQYEEGLFRSTALPLIRGEEMFNNEIEVVNGQLRQDMERMGCAAAISNADKFIFCQKDPGLNDKTGEAYRISITKDKITVWAAHGQGLYNGLQTCRQLVLSEFCEGALALPCAAITDYPRFPWRGFMLDCSRYFYSVSFIKRLMDVLSMHHINRFHWHITDDQGWRLPVAEYPLLTEIGSFRGNLHVPSRPKSGGHYSEDEIREVVDYAASRHIEIIPEVDLPGHASAILASYPGLGCTGGPYQVEDRFGIFDDVLCAGNDQVFDLIEKVIATLVRLFPSSYIHIGGDEVPFVRWENCPKCQKRLAELGLKKAGELQSWITLRLVQMLAKHGKTAIGWDEVLEDSPQFKLPKETVVMSWQGSRGGVHASRLGHKVIMTPNTNGCYLDYKHIDDYEEPGQLLGISSVYTGYSMDPVTPEMTDKEAALIMGGQCNLWSELINAGKIAEYMIFPRVCAISEVLWSPREARDFDNFSRRLVVHQKRLDSLGLQQYRGPLRQAIPGNAP
ncbi:MAG: beta-N-acetylhexosaminidase [Treponema sp.]|nr:beta-N-acetylhexosaminidase [Treponema sp.]